MAKRGIIDMPLPYGNRKRTKSVQALVTPTGGAYDFTLPMGAVAGVRPP